MSTPDLPAFLLSAAPAAYVTAPDTTRPAGRQGPHRAGPPAGQAWTATRPGDLVGRQPTGAKLGRQGPDQGYGLKLVRRLADRLELAPGEHLDDVIAGNLAVGLARASLFGRAPVIHDLELAFTVWGYLGGAPPELVTYRKPLFWRRRTTTGTSARSSTRSPSPPCA